MTNDKDDVLIIIDYQKAFKNENSAKTVKIINKLAKMYKWDMIIQTMWFNSGDENNLFMQNLSYDECQLEDKAGGLVKMFPNVHVFPRVNQYSCATKQMLEVLNYNMNIYVCGWETDACVLATLFSFFDNGISFKVVSEATTSKTEEIDEAARKVIKRQFGDVMVKYDELEVEKKKLLF